LKKVHWSDTDAAGIVWFPNFLGWFEDAEEELFKVVLGRSRQSLLDDLAFAMPRVEASAKYRAPVRAGQLALGTWNPEPQGNLAPGTRNLWF
jgi:acyl-CoA thioesterase FadM